MSFSRQHLLFRCGTPRVPMNYTLSDRQYLESFGGAHIDRGHPLTVTAKSVSFAQPSPLEAQRSAVEHGDGPCLVLAAPGSGKTYVVTQRFIRLVRDEAIEPHQILALAYNRRAADQMLERVERELSPISGDPPLTTYHSWALGVVRRFGWRVGRPEFFRIPSGAERSLHLGDVLREVRPATLFDPSRPYDSLSNVKKLIERAKQELVSPAAYLQHVEAQLAVSPSGEETIYWERQRDLAIVYGSLQERYRELRLVDHEDAIAIAAQLLRDDEEVRSAYASIRYVMVDEFQDTNSAQAAMVEALVRDHRNVMVVADDDQAIYRFRGASRLNIERFRQTFPELREIPLTINRRSTPEIVSFTHAVISASSERERKVIEPMRDHGSPVQVVWAGSYRDEAAGVVERIQGLLAAGAAPSDIAVLTQVRDDMEPISRALRGAAIPHLADKGRDLFRTPEIKGIMALVEAIHDPDGGQALLRCLQLPAWEMSQLGRLEVIRASNRTDLSALDMLRNGELDDLNELDRARGVQIASDLLDLHAMALHTDVRDVFEETMLRTSYPSLGDVDDVLERVQFSVNVSRFYEIIDEYCRYQKNGLLADALDYLRLVRQTGEEREASIDQEVEAVRIATIHGSKGLEWDHVIVCAATQGKLPRRDRRDTFALPPDLVEGVIDVPDSHKEEQRRLFYVGLTRAKNTLTVTWARRYANDYSDSKRTEFLDPVAEDLYEAHPAPIAALVAPPRRRLPELARDSKIVLSYSAIDDFNECPRRFEYRSLWRVPPVFSAQRWYGDLLHRVLFRLGDLRLGGGHVDQTTVETLWTAEWEASGDRGRVRDLRSEGLQLLQAYVASPLWADVSLAAVEHDFRIPIENKTSWLLTGKIDRVDMGTDGIPIVVDYKSGSPGDESTARSSLQLKLYGKVAMEHYHVDEVLAELHWLQTAEASRVSWSAKDIAKLDWRLLRTFEDVATCQGDGHYPARPSAYRCTRCAFQLICPERIES
jgi:DNA helicase II / ATP-dependent DNA helicase PcrA